MKKLFIIVTSIIVLFGIGIFFLSNDSSKTEDTKTKVEKISLSREIKTNNGQLIDVREPSEYNVSHADGAINIPVGDILKADYSKIDSDSPIYLYCRSGNRAEQAKNALEQAGFKDVTNIGGLVDWQNQGDKVCSSSVPSC